MVLELWKGGQWNHPYEGSPEGAYYDYGYAVACGDYDEVVMS